MATETHECPGSVCTRTRPVDNRLFCCSACWFALSHGARLNLIKTALLPLLSLPRRAAIEAAKKEWEAM